MDFNKMNLNRRDVYMYKRLKVSQSDIIAADASLRKDIERRGIRAKFNDVIKKCVMRGESVEQIYKKIRVLYESKLGIDPLQTIIYYANKYNKPSAPSEPSTPSAPSEPSTPSEPER